MNFINPSHFPYLIKSEIMTTTLETLVSKKLIDLMPMLFGFQPLQTSAKNIQKTRLKDESLR